MSAENPLRWDLSDEIYAKAARECAGRYRTIRVVRVGVDGDLDIDLAADSRIETQQFTACYWEAIDTRVKTRAQRGQPNPEQFNLKPDVAFD